MEVNVNLPVRRSVRFCLAQNIPRVFNFFFSVIIHERTILSSFLVSHFFIRSSSFK